MKKIILVKKKNLVLIVLTALIVSLSNVFFSFSLGNITKAAVEFSSSSLILWSMSCLLFLVISFLFDVLNNNYRKNFSKDRVILLKRKIFAKIDTLSNKTLNNEKETYLYNLVKEDLTLIYNDYFSSIAFIISLSIKLIGSVIALLFLDAGLFLIFILFALIPIFLGRYYDKKVAESKKIFSHTTQTYVAQLNEYFEGIALFKVFHKMNAWNQKIEEADQNYEEKRAELGKMAGKSGYFANLLGMITMIGCMSVAALYIIVFHYPISLITTSTQLLNYILFPFNTINANVSLIKSSKAIVQKYEDFFALPSKINLSANIQNADLIFEDVSFAYDTKTVLTNFSWTITQGSKNLIIGASGSGKSTIIKLLLNELVPENGKIIFSNTDLNKISEDELYQFLAYVPQKPVIFDASLKENITLFAEISNSAYENILEKCNLTSLKNLDTLGYRGNKISGGEAQKVAIARALLQNRKIMLLDEPTSALDKEAKAEIVEILLNLNDITIIMVSHDYKQEWLEKFDFVLNLAKIKKN